MNGIVASALLTLQWCDPQGLYGHGWARIGNELQRAFEPLQLAVHFTNSAGGIPVVLVRSEPEDWGFPADAMGAVAGPRDRPRIYVFFSTVARALGYRPEVLRERWPTQREERNLSRAFARVIAHEAVHALLPSRPHGEEGITRWKLDRSALLASRIEFDPVLAQELRSVLGPATITRSEPSSSRR
jgi:hypothetical protein